MVTGARTHLFAKELPPSGMTVRHAILDTGAKQRDAFSVDQRGSLETYLSTAGGPHRTELLDQETSWLRQSNVHLIVTDIVPLACVAAVAANLPCIAVSNFSWDFIFSEYLTDAGSAFKDIVWQIADDYSRAHRLLRLPGYVPMPAFREVIDVPLVVRHARRTRTEVRQDMNLPSNAKIACFIYGGQPPGEDWALRAQCLPPGWLCLVCSGGRAPTNAATPLPSSFILVPQDAYTPDIIEASDVVLGKIGYGTASECLAHRRPLVFLRRDFFNEEPFLRKLLEVSGAAVEMKRRDFLAGNWGPYLERAQALRPSYTQPTNGAEVVAAELIRTVAVDFHEGGFIASPPISPSHPHPHPHPSRGAHQRKEEEDGVENAENITNTMAVGSQDQHPGQSRLHDTIAWGYMMARHASRRSSDGGVVGGSDVPEWYTRGQLPSASISADSTKAGTHNSNKEGETKDELRSQVEVMYDLSATELEQYSDTMRFLNLIGSLQHISRSLSALEGAKPRESHPSPSGVAESLQQHLPEVRAAAGLFQPHEPLHITRAPGRLDVMGGIADYSGSSVLQMPIAEAAHVALQLQSPRHQRLWRHMHPRHRPPFSNTICTTTSSSSSSSSSSTEASHAGVGEKSSRPALRIVSLNADATNRGPAFDMDISELYTDTSTATPISYGQARRYFRQDPAQSWAAYVAGALVVLMREKGVRPRQGIAMLVSSEVPEGKGVSSSAAIEVAAMSALASAHGVVLEGRELALLCQKVENLVVGAPCGVMDQMASALGQAGQLLALRCQPAEVEGEVVVPGEVKFWGIDSGIRHSVGGSDYGGVRVGAFMGLKIIQYHQQLRQQRHSSSTSTAAAANSANTIEYLANIQPSVFERSYRHLLPEKIKGKDFLETYGAHIDEATTIDPEKTYAVRVPTLHPVYENFRVLAFRQLLGAAATGTTTTTATASSSLSSSEFEQQARVLGELMCQSHVSYSACGLGSEGTDRLVSLVEGEREGTATPALFGAKITGGGCGGTVCVLGTNDEAGEEAVRRVVARYEQETGHSPVVFHGSSPGAAQFDVLKVVMKDVLY